MTVPTYRSREDYTGNGVTTSYPYQFRIYKATDLVVTRATPAGVETTLVLNTDYTVTGVGKYAGGNVVLTSVLASGYRLAIERAIPVTQETDLRNQGAYFAETHEDVFDRAIMILQRIAGYLGLGPDGAIRTLLLGKTDIDGQGAYRARQNRIQDLADPVADQDAVNKRWSTQLVADSLTDGSGNAVLQILASSDPDNGVQKVYGATRTVANYASVREFLGSAGRLEVAGRSNIFDSAGGIFEVDTTDFISADDDGTILVDVLNRRWKRVYRGEVNVIWFGANGLDVTDDHAALQAALNTGKHVFVPDGQYRSSASLTISTYGQRVTFESRNTRFQFTSDVDGLVISNSFVEVENGYLVGSATSTTSITAGIKITNSIHSRFKFVYVSAFGYGAQMFGATANYVNKFEQCYMYLNRRAGYYGCGHATSISGGEVAGSVYGVLQAKLKDGAELAIDRDYASVIGQAVIIDGVTIEAIGNTPKTVSSAVNNGSGLIRLTVVDHRYSTGDYISVAEIVGTTEAIGVWPITVIDADTIDLKASVFANAYISGGKTYRGAGIYTGVGQGGPRVTNCYFEQLPIVYHAGDSFKNDGTTAHTTSVLNGSLVDCFISAPNYPTAALVSNRVQEFTITGNYAAGPSTTLVNGIDNNFVDSRIRKSSNYGFTAEYPLYGTTKARNMLIKPVTKNNDVVFEVQLPSASGSGTLLDAMQITNYIGATFTTYFRANVLFGGQIRGASNISINFGTGSPNGVVSAFMGSIFLRSDGGANTSFYVKESGAGTNTGWVAK